MLKIRRPLGRLIFNMGIAIPGKTVFLIETAPRLQWEERMHHSPLNRAWYKWWLEPVQNTAAGCSLMMDMCRTFSTFLLSWWKGGYIGGRYLPVVPLQKNNTSPVSVTHIITNPINCFEVLTMQILFGRIRNKQACCLLQLLPPMWEHYNICNKIYFFFNQILCCIMSPFQQYNVLAYMNNIYTLRFANKNNGLGH